MPSVGKVSDKKLTAVGAYIFAGGFTAGMKAAGFRVICHLEDGKFGVETSRLNHPEVLVYQEPSSWPTARLKASGVEVVYCNPPCSPWSTAGIVKGQTFEQQVDWRTHEKSHCVTRCFSLLRLLRPRVWCFESVRQVHSKAGEMLDQMVAEAASLGYAATDLFTEAWRHGVPQHRKRYFLVLHSVEIDWTMPDLPTPTVYEALARCDYDGDSCGRVPGAIQEVISEIRQGENARKTWERLGSHGKQPAFIYDRMAGDRPSYTLLGSCNKLHPDEDRMLSVNETKVLCGFPPDYRMAGGVNDRYAQLGKGVCPPVAEWLGKNIRRALDANEGLSETYRRRVDVG